MPQSLLLGGELDALQSLEVGEGWEGFRPGGDSEVLLQHIACAGLRPVVSDG